jgi:hypothetical protein
MIIASPFVALAAYNQYRNGEKSKNWPTVDGKVTHSSVEQKRGRRGAIRYEAKVEYQFSVKGQEYRGSRVTFVGSLDSSEPAAQAIANRYPVSSTPRVYYDPDDPSCCALEPGTNSGGALVMAIVPFVLAFAGVGLIWKNWKPR